MVYPGDYLRYHAHFTSQVLVRDEPIRPGEIVAWGRLGTGTKKAGLICCWDDGVRAGVGNGKGEVLDGVGQGDDEGKEGGRRGGKLELEMDEGEVEFYSLEWANFG